MGVGKPNHSKKEDNVTVPKKKILFMDDDETITKFVTRALTRLGYEVIIAHDGNKAISLYSDAKKSGQPFDIVILDLVIPSGMDGKETIKKLIEFDPHIIAIISSGHTNHAYMTNYSAFGFKGAIAKPYTIDDLHSTITEALQETP